MTLWRVNLILFEAAEIEHSLPRSDRRARHILEVLRRKPGDTFDAGIVNGLRGKGTLVAIGDKEITLTFAGETAPQPAAPITLIVGLPRPQTARDILRDATTLGVGAIHFVRTEKSEPSYAQSTLWTSGEWRRLAIAGAEQAFDTRIPEITHGRGLAEVVASLPPATTRIALDNYESPTALSQIENVTHHVTFAIGGERGWSAAERALLRAQGFRLTHLGPRILRTETACVAAIAMMRARLGLG
jgi:RsmE family RNA methyltransferase